MRASLFEIVICLSAEPNASLFCRFHEPFPRKPRRD
eukprot:COSAG04_NODE_7868_length_1054_cov_1.312042_3_plen_35_part_01